MHEQAGVTLSFDGWKNIVNQELLGVRSYYLLAKPRIEEMLCDFEKQKIAAIATWQSEKFLKSLVF